MATSFTKLSTGSINKILRDDYVDGPVVFQVLGCRRINPASADSDTKARYRVVLSDGEVIHNFGMLSIEDNLLYESNQLTDYTIIKAGRITCSIVNRNDPNERRIIILFNTEVLHSGDDVGRQIGDPVKATQNPVQKENLNGNAPQSHNQYQRREETSAANSTMNMSSANLNEHLTMPIDTLSPYQHKWVIKARVMSKSVVRTWNNAKGEGKLFSFDLCDETGEIRATAFNAQVDKFYDMLEVDKVYLITRCSLKPANKQYSKLRNDYEMSLNNESVIQECTDTSDIPAVKYEFVPISDIGNMEAGAIVDVIGVCKEASDVVNLVSKAGKELTKREVTLVDHSNTAITLTLWGEEAKNFDGMQQPVLLVKGARIGEYGGGKTLGTASGTALKLNPDIPEGHRMRGWFDNDGLSSDIKQLSTRQAGNSPAEWVNFHESKLRNMGTGDKPDYFQVHGFIHNIRSSNSFYKACPNADCNKKVVDQENGSYRCDKCNTESTNFKYRLLVNMLVGDWTSNRWVTAFSEVAENFLGKTAQEVGEMLENDKDNAEALFTDISFQPKTFKIRSKVETYQDVPKNKMTVLAVSDTNHKDYNKNLLANIHRLTGISKAPQ